MMVCGESLRVGLAAELLRMRWPGLQKPKVLGKVVDIRQGVPLDKAFHGRGELFAQGLLVGGHLFVVRGVVVVVGLKE